MTDKNKYSISSKLDIGVHKYFNIEQEEYFFDFSIIDESVSLLINSKEQIIVEKLKSLLKFGITSTRFKDIFDFYYLINNENLDKDKLIKYIDILIFKDENMREHTIEDIIESILNYFEGLTVVLSLGIPESLLQERTDVHRCVCKVSSGNPFPVFLRD